MASIIIKGMSCNHCKMSVTEALENVKGITKVQVDLPTGAVSFEETEPVDEDEVKAAVDKIGFSIL